MSFARNSGRILFVTVGLLIIAARSGPAQEVDRSPYSLGGFHRTITTSSEDAQLWFDRGLALCYAFNHEEAIQCFERVAEADPACAMAYWGLAYASGPNINNMEMDEAAVARAFNNATKATELKDGASAPEAALIGALARRYTMPAPEDRTHLELAYANAMREVARVHSDDADITAMFAEALMLLRPWYHWTPQGEAMPETPEILATLEAGMEVWPEHPALCHLYIHAMEASPMPHRALPAANRLRERMPGAGHLVHMPSHIDVLVGDYDAAIKANLKAIEADQEYVKMDASLNFYTLYRIHNYHFVVYAAMFDGQSELATKYADALVETIPEAMLAEMPDFLEAFVPTPLHVLVRFGKWNEILEWQKPPAELYVTRAVWHYARALALASTGKVDDAAAEKLAFDIARSAVPDTRLLFNNSAKSILGVADAMINGEIAYRRGNFDVAFEHLREAVRRDDSLNYDEPWGWMQPARHSLGALLLEQGEVDRAEEVYLLDLKRHPKNVWALHGLAECLERGGKVDEAEVIRAQYTEACSRADVGIKASCYCRLSAMGK